MDGVYGTTSGHDITTEAMKNKYRIGKGKENEIVIKDKACSNLQAEINYVKGYWILNNLVKDNPIYLNEEYLDSPKRLNKKDKIKIGEQTIHWSNYLYEGEHQEIELKNIFTYHGRLSRSNYRALSTLAIGLIICIFFSPGLLGKVGGRGKGQDVAEEITQGSMPLIYIIGFSIIGIAMILLSIKRMRDTGHPIWKLFIPFLNLKILYFEKSYR